MRNGEVSYWWRALGGFPPRRPSLPGPAEADVCVVGGGYTGLWTAYYLAGLRPGLRIVVLEAELRSTVDEVGRVCDAESIACDFVKGGRLSVATTPSQLARG